MEKEVFKLVAISPIPHDHGGFRDWTVAFAGSYRLLVFDQKSNGEMLTLTVSFEEARKYRLGDDYEINLAN